MSATSELDGRFLIKRVYEAATASDGARYLVDRLWPRGIRKDALPLTAWLADVAPSTELRRWYHRDLSQWPIFLQRYWDELQAAPAAWQPLLDAASLGPITLLYASRDTDHNHALALQAFLAARWRSRLAPTPASPPCFAAEFEALLALDRQQQAG